jgi:glycosyltransferase involved in cell wall biosynthesis
MSLNSPSLSLIIPCFNEEEVFPETAKRITQLLNDLINTDRISPESYAYFVDDGSRDRTWSLIEAQSETSGRIRGIKLSRNFGHQYALMAGLMNAPGQVVISLDADLQDDLGAINDMLLEYAKGADVVFGVRSARTHDTRFKRWTARGYYKLLEWMDVEVVYDHADYRLLSRRAIEALREFEESNLFLRALIPRLGFEAAIVEYARAERFAGESKYPLGKMLSLAVQGITSFSVRPLRMVTQLGLAISFISFGLGIWALIAALVFRATVPGWASTVVPIYLVCGIQMLCIGIVGEYTGKIYLETKRRPRFIVDRITKVGPPPANEHSVRRTAVLRN